MKRLALLAVTGIALEQYGLVASMALMIGWQKHICERWETLPQTFVPIGSNCGAGMRDHMLVDCSSNIMP
jgi:hypothetical protein